MNISRIIDALVSYGVQKNLIGEADRVYARNRILDILELDSYEGDVPDGEITEEYELQEMLNILLDDAAERGVLPENLIVLRDLLDTKIMDALTPFPSEVERRFHEALRHSPEDATNFYYAFAKDTNYIRTDRIRKDKAWKAETEYGVLDITINRSKPEKDPRAIALAGKAKKSGYPACMLCLDNEGYRGRIDFPARNQHRPIAITLDKEPYYLQYSPYVYYNEHCIVFHRDHVPMKISKQSFRRLLSFVEQFPHYFLGSNADLPIVGGSILSHDHFQGGKYEFAMERAETEVRFHLEGEEETEIGIVKWPMSVLRIRHKDKDHLADVAERITEAWRAYSDPEVGLYSETEGEPHNTVTPIARIRGGAYEMDLVLRNNRRSEEHPLGIFHPHENLHHIKKENIGLIEVMGLAVLPARLEEELTLLKTKLLNGDDIEAEESIRKHAPWAKELREKYQTFSADTIDQIIENEVGEVFLQVLSDAGVFKRDREGQEAFRRFLASL